MRSQVIKVLLWDLMTWRLGSTGIHVTARALGLVLAVIAVQFVLDALVAAKVIPPMK